MAPSRKGLNLTDSLGFNALIALQRVRSERPGSALDKPISAGARHVSVESPNCSSRCTTRIVPVLLISSLTLTGCINAAEKYRRSNKDRRAYDLYADSSIPSKIDV